MIAASGSLVLAFEHEQVGSSITNLNVATGSEDPGLVQQNAATGAQPQVTNAPVIGMTGSDFAIPSSIAVPPGI